MLEVVVELSDVAQKKLALMKRKAETSVEIEDIGRKITAIKRAAEQQIAEERAKLAAKSEEHRAVKEELRKLDPSA